MSELKQKSIPHTTTSGYPVIFTDHLAEEELLSCKVYGAENGVGDLVTSGEHEGKYVIPVIIRGKNLFNINEYLDARRYTSAVGATVSGNTVTFSSGGSLTVNGNSITLNGRTSLNLYLPDLLKRLKPDTKYTISVTDKTSSKAIALSGKKDGNPLTTTILGNNAKSAEFTLSSEDFPYYQNFVLYAVSGGTTFTGIQIEEGSTKTDYESYAEPSEATVYLDEPLTEGESVSVTGINTLDSDKVTIQTGTTVSPEKIDIEYYQDINKVISELKAAILSQGGNV